MQKLFTLALAMASATMLFAQSFSNASSSLPDSYNSGNCVGFTDMNNDGFDDIVVLDQSKTVKVLYQDGDGAFTEVDYGSVSNSNQWGMTIGDYDNDGHKDVFSGGSYDGVHIKHIDAVGSYTDMQLDNGNMFMQACNFADIDNDGQLDVFGCHDDALSRMWSGNGSALDYNQELFDLTNYDFSDYPTTDHSGNYGTVWCDFDQDGDLDLTIAKCRQFVGDPFDPRRINQLWINDGNNNYTEAAEERGAPRAGVVYSGAINRQRRVQRPLRARVRLERRTGCEVDHGVVREVHGRALPHALGHEKRAASLP